MYLIKLGLITTRTLFGIFKCPTYLKPGIYEECCFLTPTEVTTTKGSSYATTYYCRNSETEIWTMVPPFPSNSRYKKTTKKYVTPKLYIYDLSNLKAFSPQVIEIIDGAERQKKMFRHIVTKTNNVAIGPLEYFGHSVVYKMANGKKR